MNSAPETGGDDGADVIRSRGPEVAVAVLLLVIAALVIKDSLRVGVGWADDGPKSGTFPFYVGSILAACSAWVLFKQLMSRTINNEVFAERSQLKQVLSILFPMLVYVALVYGIGIYVASFLLIAYFMKRYGQYGWGLTAAVSAGVPLVVFLVFERWFLVLLPKGPLERILFGL